MWQARSLKGLRAPAAVGKEGELQSASSDEVWYLQPKSPGTACFRVR